MRKRGKGKTNPTLIESHINSGRFGKRKGEKKEKKTDARFFKLNEIIAWKHENSARFEKTKTRKRERKKTLP